MKDFFGDILIAALNTPKTVWLFILGPTFCVFALFVAHIATSPVDPNNLLAGVVKIIQEDYGNRIVTVGLLGWGACWLAALRLVLKQADNYR